MTARDLAHEQSDCGRDAGAYVLGALDAGEDSDEGRGPVQPVAGDGVADRLAEAEHGGGDRPRRDHVAQFGGSPDVPRPGGQLRGPAAGRGTRTRRPGRPLVA